MNLKDLNKSPIANAKKALREHFNTDLKIEKLSLQETSKMLSKVRKIANETRNSTNLHTSQRDPSYMKLVVLEQALVHHHNYLVDRAPRIVVENEEVDQAQVIMAAQDMIDRLQDMVEDISDMLVKELPAVADSVRAQFGTTESNDFSTKASDALRALADAISTAKSGVSSALGVITGQDTDQSFDAPEADDDMDMDIPDDIDMGDDMEDDTDLDMPDETDDQDQEDMTPALGRQRR